MANFFKHVSKHFSKSWEDVKNHIKKPDQIRGGELALYGVGVAMGGLATGAAYCFGMLVAPWLTLGAHAVMAAGIFGMRYAAKPETKGNFAMTLFAPLVVGGTAGMLASLAVISGVTLAAGACGAVIKGAIDAARDKNPAPVKAEALPAPAIAPETSTPAALPAPKADEFNLNGGLNPRNGEVLRVKVERVKKPGINL